MNLLPCPFCGASAGNVALRRGHGFIIGCSQCQAQQYAETLDEAEAQWNRRYTVTEERFIKIVEEVKQKALDGTWQPYFRAGMLYTCEKIDETLRSPLERK